MRIKQLIIRYAWAGPIAGFAVGFLFGPGVLWQYTDYRLKNHSVTLEKIRIEKELYERLQSIQNEVSSIIPQYIILRDQYFPNKRNYQLQNEYYVTKTKLVSLITGYNRLEAKLSCIEGRSPHFYVIPIPPLQPYNFKIQKTTDDSEFVFTWDHDPEPLEDDVKKDAQALFQQYGHKFPSDQSK